MKTKPKRFIVEIHSGIDPLNAFALCGSVMLDGEVSETGACGKQYCFHTSFRDGIQVSVHKRKTGTQRFIVWRR